VRTSSAPRLSRAYGPKEPPRALQYCGYIAATRITLTSGATVVVKGSVRDVESALASAISPDAAHLQPVALGHEPPPEVIALRIDDVQMLADATPWGDEAAGEGSNEPR